MDMLIGGMFDIDMDRIHETGEKEEFPLRCDSEHRYRRKVYTNNGRTATTYAFQYGIKPNEEDVVLIPEYNCISVINAMEAAGVKFDFYAVTEELHINMDDLKSKITEQTKVLYVIHYFGIPQPQEIVDELLWLAREKNLIIVEDLTQALLTASPGRIGFGDYLVASTRKWYPVTDGGIVVARDDVPFEVVHLENAYDEAVYRQSLVALARRYYQEDPAKDIHEYLWLEKEANKARYLDFTPRAMTEASRNILFHSNHQESMKKRRENYNYLYTNLKAMEGIRVFASPLDEWGDYIPFGFMVIVDERDNFYEYLAKNYIIGEIQWILPIEYYTPGAFAMYLSEHSLMLQCDQRYDIEDMRRVVEVIRQYIKKAKGR